MSNFYRGFKRTRGPIALVIAIAFAPTAILLSSAMADRIPPLGGQNTPYPAAFLAYMTTNYGPVWMHTVQEEVVRRIYMSWLRKEAPKPIDKDKP